MGRAVLAADSMAEDSAEAASTAAVVDAGSRADGISSSGASDTAAKSKVRACQVTQEK